MAISRKTLVILGVAVGVVSCCGLGGLILLGTAIAPEVDKARRESDKAQGKVPWAEAQVSLKSQLAKLHANVPEPAALALKSCPDAEIQNNYKEPPSSLQGEVILWMPSVPYEILGRWLVKGLEAKDRDEWLWMTDGGTAQLLDPARYDGSWFEEDMASTLRHFRNARYLAILRAERRSMPRLTGDPELLGLLARWGRLEKGKTFQAGSFQGWIVLMDLQTAEPVCHAPLAVENSETLEYRTSGPLKKEPQALIEADFKERVRESIKGAVAGISKVLRLTIRG